MGTQTFEHVEGLQPEGPSSPASAGAEVHDPAPQTRPEAEQFRHAAPALPHTLSKPPPTHKFAAVQQPPHEASLQTAPSIDDPDELPELAPSTQMPAPQTWPIAAQSIQATPPRPQARSPPALHAPVESQQPLQVCAQIGPSDKGRTSSPPASVPLPASLPFSSPALPLVVGDPEVPRGDPEPPPDAGPPPLLDPDSALRFTPPSAGLGTSVTP